MSGYLESLTTGNRVAYYPIPIGNILSNHEGRTWAGPYGFHFFILSLEGVDNRHTVLPDLD